MPNVGEEDEPKVIKKLVSLKGNTLPTIGTILSVKDYQGEEYPSSITIEEIEKAPSFAKRDVIINDFGVSLKSKGAAPPAIVNHTSREKWIRVAKAVGLTIDPLDKMVDEYWALRMSNKIAEDVYTYDDCCPFGENEKEIEYLEKILTYFLFEGTGTKDSKYPAEFILEFGDPNNPDTWSLLNKKQAFHTLWPNIKFSLRAKKGMPRDYDGLKPSKKKLLVPWVRYIDGDYRGALHIRAK